MKALAVLRAVFGLEDRDVLVLVDVLAEYESYELYYYPWVFHCL